MSRAPLASRLPLLAAGLLACAPPAWAGAQESLQALWVTPGNNIVEIRAVQDGALTGFLVSVTREAQAQGFRVGQTVLTSFKVNDRTVGV